MKRRLSTSSLPTPLVAFTGQQSLAQKGLELGVPVALTVIPMVALQDVLNKVRALNQPESPMSHSKTDDGCDRRYLHHSPNTLLSRRAKELPIYAEDKRQRPLCNHLYLYDDRLPW
jgi:hypothetical protein